jgi:predicted secreted hydrolase
MDWTLTIPTLDLSLRIRPVVRSQELATSVRYWEGAVDVNGERNGKEVSGRGYVELTGYADDPT